MIHPQSFFNALRQHGIRFFTGVPDSLLKHFCAYLEDHCTKREHVIAANEGNAVALAAGYHLSTGKLACVYMQNSGLGNAVNPLTSLTDPEVYNIPLLLVIGWRGEPGITDEPQHRKQGRITSGQLELMEIPYQVIDQNSSPDMALDAAFDGIARTGSPAAILVRKGTFSSYDSQKKNIPLSTLLRETALNEILTLAGREALIVATTGKTSREVFDLRMRRGEPNNDFLTVGSMGHTSSIALGVALGNPEKQVVCIDGDGSALMHLGALPVIGDKSPENLVYVILNNAAHESVGGQRTVADRVDFGALAAAFGFRNYMRAKTLPEIINCWAAISRETGPHMIEIRIGTGSRENLGRPSQTPEENKKAFMEAALVCSQKG